MLLAAWYHPILATLFALVAVFLMMIILLQRGRGVGLAGAFGGAGGNTAFGSKTGDVLTWATVVVAAVFLLLTVVLNFVFVPQKAGLDASIPAVSATTPQPATPAPTATPTEAPDLAHALNEAAQTPANTDQGAATGGAPKQAQPKQDKPAPKSEPEQPPTEQTP